MNDVLKQLENQFGGCYLLYDGDAIVYVGESDNVPRRIHDHIRENTKQFSKYQYIPCKDRKTLEKQLIDILQPKYNIVGRTINSDNGHDSSVSIESELDKIIAVHASKGKPFPVYWTEAREFFDLPEFYKHKDVFSILGRYKAVVDDANGLVDLRQIAEFHCCIQADINKLLFNNRGDNA